MCGIAGFVDPGHRLDHAATLRALGTALAHRGPDGAGTYSHGPFGLGHRRLAIIDLSATGEQPLAVEHIVVVFNGEIYNYVELREELIRAGHSFLGPSDTEVLARAYLHWGSSFVAHLRGMWAFALLDKRSNSLLCSRDPFGIKPFYHTLHRGAFLFASEPQALLAAGVSPVANSTVAAQYLALGVCDHSTECFFAGIQQLAAGHTVCVDAAGRVELLSALDPCEEQAVRPVSCADFAECLRGSIRLHLRSDVPVGTCLSGGLDSSTVAALASKAVHEAGGGQFAAITAASGDERTDERPFARAVVEHCGLAWHVVQPDGSQFASEIDDCIRAQGEPALSPSIYMQYCVMKQARASGIKVMLDGQGGDELLCGYERYVPTFALEEARQRGMLKGLRQFLQLARQSRLGARGMTSLAAYLLLPFLRHRVVAARSSFMRRDLQDSVLALVDQMRPAFHDLRAARVADLTRFSLPALLRYEDRNSMRHSIEARVPFVDRQVASSALGLPHSDLLREGFSKYPLRLIAAEVLPQAIAWRRSKIGFEAPTGRWLETLGAQMHVQIEQSSVVQHLCRKLPALNSTSVALRWRLYNLARWQRIFAVERG